MDPLSLTASIIATLGIGGKAAGAINKIAVLKSAPDVVLALNNEITDLRFVVSAIQDTLRRQRDARLLSPGNGIGYDASVTNSLQQAMDKVTELESLYNYLQKFVSSPSSFIKFNRIAWLRKQPKIHRMLDDLKSVRLQLVGILVILNLYVDYSL